MTLVLSLLLGVSAFAPRDLVSRDRRQRLEGGRGGSVPRRCRPSRPVAWRSSGRGVPSGSGCRRGSRNTRSSGNGTTARRRSASSTISSTTAGRSGGTASWTSGRVSGSGSTTASPSASRASCGSTRRRCANPRTRGAAARTLRIDFAFLGEGAYELRSFADAEDRPDGYTLGRRAVVRTDAQTVSLRPGGGYVGWLRARPAF